MAICGLDWKGDGLEGTGWERMCVEMEGLAICGMERDGLDLDRKWMCAEGGVRTGRGLAIRGRELDGTDWNREEMSRMDLKGKERFGNFRNGPERSG